MTVIEILSLVAEIAGYISGIFALILFFVKPVRQKILKLINRKKEKQETISIYRESMKCLLRKNMLSTYYHNKDKGTIRQYELEEFILEYNAYKALGGNSFIDEIHDEVMTWEVIT